MKDAPKVYIELHHLKKVITILQELKEKIMLGTVDIIDVLADIDTIYGVLDNTKVEEE